jgi:hypothetical protein
MEFFSLEHEALGTGREMPAAVLLVCKLQNAEN